MPRVRKPLAATFCLSISLLVAACASPVEGLWPPSPDSSARTILVSLDTWHAMIALPGEPSASHQHSLTGFEEWGYAEHAWYLEYQQGVTGIARALFWPSEGVVEVGHYDRVWAHRTPQPPSDLFVFRLSDEGYRRLRRQLRESISVNTPVASVGQSIFYPAVRSYYLFHTCHQYAAHALGAAGLPVSAFWAFNRTSLRWQLRRVVRIAGEPTDVPLGKLRRNDGPA